MSKQPRLPGGKVLKGTFIRLTDTDVLLSSSQNRFLTHKCDRVVLCAHAVSREHIFPCVVCHQRNTVTNPPKLPEFLLIAFAPARRAKHMIGDLNERFADECQKLGRDRAARLYWARTLRSLWPLLKRAIGKAVKWGAVLAVVKRMF
jgi:hypothetical protein